MTRIHASVVRYNVKRRATFKLNKSSRTNPVKKRVGEGDTISLKSPGGSIKNSGMTRESG